MRIFTKFLLVGSVILVVSIFIGPKREDEGDLALLPHELSGNRNSPVMIIFLHGYPNTFRMWDRMIGNLRGDYLCLNISYPNYAKNVHRRWGVDLIEIIELIKKTVNHADPDNVYKKVFIGHDWGAAFTYLLDYKYPRYINDAITLDLGAGIQKSIKATVFTYSYQAFLAFNFLINGPIGTFFTRQFANLAHPYGLTEEDYSRIDSSWNYMYYHLFKRLSYYKDIIQKYKPSCSIAYVYGTLKPFLFHNEEFLSNLKDNPRSEVHAVNEGHWVMDKHHDFLVDLIRKRINTYIK